MTRRRINLKRDAARATSLRDPERPHAARTVERLEPDLGEGLR
jgi:hypothetical protein